MIKLKTKTEFPVPTSRSVLDTIIRLIIDKIEIDINNIRPSGYYYRLDEEGQVVVLDQIGQNSTKQWETIETVENNLLAPLVSNQNLKANILQRVNEFTMMQIEQEANENYGTVASDWVIDNDDVV